MNGLHDMGGMHGFGKVEVEKDEPVFHHRWEARVFGIVRALGGGNIDAGRHSIERLDPISYLRDGYYGRWFAALTRSLVEFGVLGDDEIARRAREVSPPGEGRPTATRSAAQTATSFRRDVAASPKFSCGDTVRTRNYQPPGHTRLPGYGRRHRGVVVRVHPAMVYPDDHAHGRGENPQYLYTVRFTGGELWGDAAEANTVVHIDLFEPYLEAGD